MPRSQRSGNRDALYSSVTEAVLASLANDHTKRAYERHLKKFFEWHSQTGERAISKELVQRYAEHLQRSKSSPATVNQKLSAIRTLALHLASTGKLDPQIADGIKAVQGVKQKRVSSDGHPLSKRAAQRLLNAPNTDTLKGLRDRAILALLLGCGLRRAEVADLTFDHIKRSGDRNVIINLAGTGDNTRSVTLPTWTKQSVDAYKSKAGLKSGIVFRPINRGDNLNGERMTEQAVYNLVVEYAGVARLGTVTPNDLRLTFATLAHKGGSTLDQLQLSLGVTRERLMEVLQHRNPEQDLTDAPGDYLGLQLNR